MTSSALPAGGAIGWAGAGARGRLGRVVWARCQRAAGQGARRLSWAPCSGLLRAPQGSRARGSSMVKQVPWSLLEVMATRPWWAWMIRRTTESPTPAPG